MAAMTRDLTAHADAVRDAFDTYQGLAGTL
jgi:hypothetical protein